MTKFLDQLEIGDPTTSGSLFLFPVFGGQAAQEAPLTVDQALELQLLAFEETSLAGTVPEIIVVSRADRPVFLLDGEQLLGLKQNRTFNLSMLIPPKSRTRIPVSCLEAGRWMAAGQARAAEHVHFASGRANKLRTVSASLERDGSYRSDQSRVWHDIGRKFERVQTRSATAAEADVYADRRTRLQALRAALTVRPRQIGAVVGMGAQIVGVDLFHAPRLYARLHDKLIKSYLIDALDDPRPATPPGRDTICFDLRRFFAGEPRRFSSPGCGEALRWTNGFGAAAALFSEGTCIHAVAFGSAQGEEIDCGRVVA